MGRWTDDSSPVPEGMTRIGYDSDTHRYTFRDTDGSVYEGGEAGGDLRLVSRPSHRSNDNEPIRLFPTSPTPPVGPGMKSPTSPSSFSDMLPPHLMTAATPMASSSRKPLSPKSSKPQKSPSSPTSPTSTTGTRRSLWGVVRSTTLPVKMRDVVETVIRRPSTRHEGAAEGSYARLSNSREDPQRYDGRSRDVSSSMKKPSRGPSGHVKRPTV